MTEPVNYGGFWVRLSALLLDLLILSPVAGVSMWASSNYRLFDVWFFVPNILVELFYSVYLVQRFGGTPGKRLMGLRITKLNGEAIGYREALLREAPLTILNIATSAALLPPLFKLTDAQYAALSFVALNAELEKLAPPCYKVLQTLSSVWVLSEFVVLLTNRKRRAIHDFIASTVVVRECRAP